jgi:tape measure domain-containing protein
MAAVIGSLRADLSARIANFQTNMNKAGDATSQFATRFQRSAVAAGAASGQLNRSVGGIATSTRNAERQIAASSAGIRNALLASTAGVGAAMSVEGVRRAADAWTIYTNSLRVAGLEGEALTDTQDALYQMAQRNGVAFGGLADIYGRGRQAADNLGASEQDLMRFVSGTAAAMRIQGRDAASTAGAMLQLTQLLGGTKVQAQEYNSLIDGMYPLLQAVAAGSDRWGGSVAALTNDVKASDVTTREFFEAALNGMGRLETRAAQASLTTSSSIQIITNAWSRYIGQADDALSASERFNAGARGIADNLDEIVPALAMLATAMVGQYVGSLRIGEQNVNSFAAAQARLLGGVITGSRSLNENALATKRAALSSMEHATAAKWEAIAVTEGAQAARNKLAATVSLLAQERMAAEAALRAATTERQRTLAIRAMAAARLAEAAAAKQLAVAEGQLTAATAAETTARRAATAATAQYTLAARAATLGAAAAAGAARLLSASLAFFGGPIGLAITAIGAAFLYMASSAQQAGAATEAAQGSLDEMAASAEAAGAETGTLGDELTDQAAAARESAADSRGAADAYASAGNAARNAAIHIRDMNAAQRESYALRLRQQRTDLTNEVRGQGGFLNGAFHTNTQERVDRATDRVLAAFGERRMPGTTGASELARVRAQIRAPDFQATPEQRAALEERANVTAVLSAQTQTIAQLAEAEALVLRELRTPPTPATEDADTGGGGGGGGDTATGGGGGGRDRTADEAAREAERVERDRRAFEADARRLEQDLLDAQTDLVGTAEERHRSDLQGLENARVSRQIEIDQQLADGRLTEAQAEELRLLTDQVAGRRRLVLLTEEAERQAQEAREIASAEADTQTVLLQAQGRLARTAEERRDVELRILAIQYAEERARLEAIVASREATEAEREIARSRLRILDQLQGADRDGVMRDTMGPLESYLDSIRLSAGQVNESLEEIAAEGLRSVTDGLTDAIMQSESLADVFHNVAESIIRDLVRIAVQQYLIRPFTEWMTGGSGQGGGKGGGFWSAAGNIFSAFTGGGKSGFTFPGKSPLAGAAGMTDKPLGLVAASSGDTVAKSALAGGLGGVTVNVYADRAVLADEVRSWVADGVQQAVGIAVPTAVQAATEAVPAYMAQQHQDRFI